MACAAVYGRVAGGRRPQDRLAGRVGQRDASHCERKAASVYSHDRRLYRGGGGGGGGGRGGGRGGAGRGDTCMPCPLAWAAPKNRKGVP